MRDSYPDQQSIGASCNSAGNADVDACKKACLDDDKCQALDWNQSASWQNCRCWIHTNEVALQELKDNANVDQWRNSNPVLLTKQSLFAGVPRSPNGDGSNLVL